LPAAGHTAGTCAVPAGLPVDTSRPTRVIGNGTPQSCTSDAVVAAVAQGGVVTFNCGDAPVTIPMTRTARVFNNQPDLVLDGGGRVTLSGGGRLRVLYQNSCDPNLVWTSSRCDLQANPRTTLQNLTFVDGDASGQNEGLDSVYGGGAVFARGGQLTIVNSRFFRNRCEPTGPDLGGGAVRGFGVQSLRIVRSTFGGMAGQGNVCSNGGAISGLGSSISLVNSLVTHNEAVGVGANPQRAGTPGGGSGGAIYQDGNTFALDLCGSRLAHNLAIEGGSAIFYVSNDRSGSMALRDSVLESHVRSAFETDGYPGIFVLTQPQRITVTNTVIRR
jgi:hypothetical protein